MGNIKDSFLFDYDSEQEYIEACLIEQELDLEEEDLKKKLDIKAMELSNIQLKLKLISMKRKEIYHAK